MENINYKKLLYAAIEHYKQYRILTKDSLIVSKILNKNQGALALFRFYPNRKIILVNTFLFNKIDSLNLLKIKKTIGANNWMEIKVNYDYSKKYFEEFKLNN